MSISDEMRLDMIEKIREDLKNISYPQTFDPTLHKDTNCMAHAFGAEVPDLKHNFYVPGFISGNADDLIETELVENFINDAEVLGKHAEVITREQAKKGEKEGNQVVALFYSWIDNDFHFIRKNKGGVWSHKAGYKQEPRVIKYNYENFFEREDCYITYDLIAFFNLSSL